MSSRTSAPCGGLFTVPGYTVVNAGGVVRDRRAARRLRRACTNLFDDAVRRNPRVPGARAQRDRRGPRCCRPITSRSRTTARRAARPSTASTVAVDAGRPRRHPRPERLRQDDAAQAARRACSAPDSGHACGSTARTLERAAAPRRRAAHRDRAAGDASRLRLHRPRDRADGPLSASRPVRSSKGRTTSAIAREALAATGTAAFESAALPHAQRRREAARRRSPPRSRSRPTCCCSTSPRRRSTSATSSRSRRCSRALNRERGVHDGVSTHDLNLAAAVCRTLVLLRERTRRWPRADGRGAHAATTSARSTTWTRRCTSTPHRAPRRSCRCAACVDDRSRPAARSRCVAGVRRSSRARGGAAAAPLRRQHADRLARAFDPSIPFADNVDAQIFFVARLPRVLAGGARRQRARARPASCSRRCCATRWRRRSRSASRRARRSARCWRSPSAARRRRRSAYPSCPARELRRLAGRRRRSSTRSPARSTVGLRPTSCCSRA